jgi:hypothetical protein
MHVITRHLLDALMYLVPTRDGSRLICKANGVACVVAPNCTQLGSQWAGGQYNTTQVGNKCCICEWPALNTRLLQCGFNPCDWFVPSISQLNNPGFVCRTQWDTFASTLYWSSTEINATIACVQCFTMVTSSAAIRRTRAVCVPSGV